MMNNINNPHTIIIDIGKTHVKLHVLDKFNSSAISKQMGNSVDNSGLYPCADVGKIWDWICASIKETSSDFHINKITITTHGATAALIDRDKQDGDGLVLPVLDYEYVNTLTDIPEYDDIRPRFADTYSPSLPAGLNLGRQLFWLKQAYPAQFDAATDILMYPQYWAWRFTGKRVSEITSLGCHTDLWSIRENRFSELVDTLDCEAKFPELQPAWFSLGNVSADICQQLGLPQDCEFFSGLHDSNASFLRYRLAQDDAPFTVISTGTWTILMASSVPLSNLEPTKDMLANIDALGTPIACARFMGGREFEIICERAGSWLGEQFDELDLQNIISREIFALPDFSEGSGPFGGNEASFIGAVDKASGIALATIYCALMIDYQLDMLGAKGDVIIEGAFLKNPLLCALVNQLRVDQNVLLSQDNTGTVSGAAYLTKWESRDTCKVEMLDVVVTQIRGLKQYQQEWRTLLNVN